MSKKQSCVYDADAHFAVESRAFAFGHFAVIERAISNVKTRAGRESSEPIVTLVANQKSVDPMVWHERRDPEQDVPKHLRRFLPLGD